MYFRRTGTISVRTQSPTATVYGINLEKTYFDVVCTDQTGKPVRRAKLARSNVFEFFANVAWTSNLVANSASDCAPRIAYSETFALKAAEWLRRDLLTVCSPRTGEVFAQLSKAVTLLCTSFRIFGATSDYYITDELITFRKTFRNMRSHLSP